jgi:hypothetical protein
VHGTCNNPAPAMQRCPGRPAHAPVDGDGGAPRKPGLGPQATGPRPAARRSAPQGRAVHRQPNFTSPVEPVLDRKKSGRLRGWTATTGAGCREHLLDQAPRMHHDALVRTTIDINDATLADLRERARSEGRPFKSVVEEVLQLGLAAPRRGRQRFRVKPLNPGIKAPYRAMSLNQLYDQIEAEETRP